MICFVGPLPPPTHGMANVNLAILERLRARLPVQAFSVNRDANSGLSGYLIKFVRAVFAPCAIVFARLRGAKVFYGSVDDGPGGFFAVVFVLMAKTCGMRVFLHYHSFRYIDRMTLPVTIITRVAGRSACHIALCDCMAERFHDRYPAAGSVIAVPNSVALPDHPPDISGPASDKPLTLGLLARLTFDKGLLQFIALVERARAEGLPVRGILAGPASGNARRYLEEALCRLGPALEWRGPLEGAEKERFFADVDVFVFPTDYPAEAHPLVILEALVRGLPVITKARGCIGEFAAQPACFVHPREGDFVATAMPQVAGFAAGRERLAQAAHDAEREGRNLNERNRVAADRLVDAIVAAAAIASD